MRVILTALTALTVERVPPWHLPFLGCDCMWKKGNCRIVFRHRSHMPPDQMQTRGSRLERVKQNYSKDS